LEELAAISVDPTLLRDLNDLLLEVYTLLRPKSLDYEKRNALVHVFKEMTSKIFGKFLFHADAVIRHCHVLLAFKITIVSTYNY
jgi:hypothetical protein